MSKSRLELSFDRNKPENTNACLRDGNTSLHVAVTRRSSNRGNARSNMSSLDEASPALLMQNVRDIRKRLLETEKTLNTISKVEKKLENE